MRHNYLYRLLKIPRTIQHNISYWLTPIKRRGWGSFGKNSFIVPPAYVYNRENLFIGDNVRLMSDISIRNVKGKVFIGNGTGSASHLSIITENHQPQVGETYYENKSNSDLDGGEVVIEEDVWLGENVTILPNVHVGRGAIVGAGSVLRSVKVPPYSIVVGNPAKVVGFRFNPDEIIAHELILYEEKDRLPKDKLDKNYSKYFLDRTKDIKSFLKL